MEREQELEKGPRPDGEVSLHPYFSQIRKRVPKERNSRSLPKMGISRKAPKWEIGWKVRRAEV
jgi:hypothetical protein